MITLSILVAYDINIINLNQLFVCVECAFESLFHSEKWNVQTLLEIFDEFEKWVITCFPLYYFPFSSISVLSLVFASSYKLLTSHCIKETHPKNHRFDINFSFATTSCTSSVLPIYFQDHKSNYHFTTTTNTTIKEFWYDGGEKMDNIPEIQKTFLKNVCLSVW